MGHPNRNNNTPVYRDACKLGQILVRAIERADITLVSIDKLVCAWVELEAFKREMRGIPRLKVQGIKELNEARLASLKQLTTQPAAIFTEIEPSKESLSQPAPVTAPPAPKTP